MTQLQLKLPRRCHFIGIGGIGMSGLAKILVEAGFSVSGSDLSSNAQTQQLLSLGVAIEHQHSKESIQPDMAVIYSTDIKEDNPELQAAREQGCALYHRSELLALLSRTKKTLAITGCHGKTTTSALVAHILEKAGLNPSYAVGGVLQNGQTHAKWGSGEWLVIEADESDGSFLNYAPYGAIVTNIDEDHMNHFKTKDNVVNAFEQFIAQIQNKESALLNVEDPILNGWRERGVGYGLNRPELPYWAQVHKRGRALFSMGGETFEVRMPLLGEHNVSNVLGAFALAYSIGIPAEAIVEGIESFPGVKRRCEIKGSVSGITFMDDYAHHPKAIEATLKAIAESRPESIIAIFQPHRYSRMEYILKEYPQTLNRCFAFADKVIVTDIYGAGEQPIEGVTTEKVVNAIGEECCYCPRKELAATLAPLLRPGDLVVSLGAGNLSSLGDEILDIYRTKPPSKLKIGLISGGRSIENSVSHMSADHLLSGWKTSLYECVSFSIDALGYWSSASYQNEKKQRVAPEILEQLYACDFLIPLLHGPYGEDGRLQGFLETLTIPYAFSNVAACAVSMDKVYTKYVAQSCGIPTPAFVSMRKREWIEKQGLINNWIRNDLPLPVFVKGVHLGSTLGVFEARTQEEVFKALEKAFKLDDKVIVEEAVTDCREFEVVIVSANRPIVLPPFEILKKGAVHDFEGKYTKEGNPNEYAPSLTGEQRDNLLSYAQRLFEALGCTGIVRIDFFIDRQGRVLFNEVNPIPGLTQYSGVPGLFAHLGKGMEDILKILVQTGMKAHRKQMKLYRS